MKKNKIKFLKALKLNIILLACWHIISFILCVYLKGNIFDSNKKCYQPKSWEKNGKWYKKNLKINKWKDLLPQHVGKGGFSKQKMNTNLSDEYLDDFIYETCRGEWNHKVNSFFCIVALFFNFKNSRPLMGIFVSACTLIGNLPFIAIQRYNRFRLIYIKKNINKKKDR